MGKTKVILKALWEDITYNKVIFVSLIVLLIISNLMVFITESTLSGLDKSIQNVRSQLGADIIVVSKEYDSNLKNALFSGTPSSFSFSNEAYEGIRNIEGIEQYSSNLFVSSLDSSCCEVQVEFVIYDEQSDFILKSLIEQYDSKMSKRDIIIGSDIQYEVGDDVTFFGCIFHVAGKCKPTGMGYDQCIFANQKCGESISNFLKLDSFYDRSSMLLIKKKEGYDIDVLCNNLNADLENKGLVAYKTLNIYTDVEENVQSIKSISICYIVFLMILICVSIFIITFMNIEAKGKYSIILYILGVKKRKICEILLIESMIIAGISTIVGNITGMAILLLFRTLISETMKLPVYVGRGVLGLIGMNIIFSILLVIITTLIAYKVALPEKEQYKRKLT